jgi:MerR family transcriptional regulator, redox-sensitive transcriptional activator SoxR
LTNAALSIGEVASKAGVNVSAIRFYERRGLLPEPERVGGQRRYTADAIRRLGVISAAKQAGFSLEEIRVLLASADEGLPAHEQLRALATRKLPQVDALIERAEGMRAWLAAASECGCDSFDSCGLFANADQP